MGNVTSEDEKINNQIEIQGGKPYHATILMSVWEPLGLDPLKNDNESPLSDCYCICTSNSLKISRQLSTIDDVIEINYSNICEIAWDHALFEVKFSLLGLLEGEDSFILRVVSAIKFEHELLLCLQGKERIPFFTYIGIFAGSRIPSFFQRKRPNITTIDGGILPTLTSMRVIAEAGRRGRDPSGETTQSRRMSLALQHIFEGFNIFPILSVSRNGELSALHSTQSLFLITYDEVIFLPHGVKGQRQVFRYEQISSWEIELHDQIADSHGLSGIYIAYSDRGVFFSFQHMPDVVHTMEYFWNLYQTSQNKPEVKGSTHGRSVCTIFSLSGEIPVSPVPDGNRGAPLLPDSPYSPFRSGLGTLMLNSPTIQKRVSFTAQSKRRSFETKDRMEHWSRVVVHQGELLKQGGAGVGNMKRWKRRYFILYATSQGHFLSYYSSKQDCPYFNLSEAQRNFIDLAKTTMIRHCELNETDPTLLCFDIQTIERQWTLGTHDANELQTWLQLLTRSVDEDVAIIPDEQYTYSLKPTELGDPGSVVISAQGVEILPSPPGVTRHFCYYTDIIQWSLVDEKNKHHIDVAVYSDGGFNQTRNYRFKFADSSQAISLKTQLDFFLEKFLHCMHVLSEVSPQLSAAPRDDICLPSGSSEDQEYRIFYESKLCSRELPLYTSSVIHLTLRVEVRAAQAKISVLYKNPSLTHQCTIVHREMICPDGIAAVFSPPSDGQLLLQPNETFAEVFFLHCTHPFISHPFLNFCLSNTPPDEPPISCRVPIFVVAFNAPLVLPRSEFDSKWERIVSPELSTTALIHTPLPKTHHKMKSLGTALRFHSVEAPAEEIDGDGSLSLYRGASYLTFVPSTSPVVIGCLLLIETSEEPDAVRVTLKTTNANATIPLLEALKGFLE